MNSFCKISDLASENLSLFQECRKHSIEVEYEMKEKTFDKILWYHLLQLEYSYNLFSKNMMCT